MSATFAPLGVRGSAAIVALYVKLGACLMAIGADVGRIVVAGRLADGGALVDDLLDADRLVYLGAAVELLALAVAAVLFLRWQLTAQRNLAALGDDRPPGVPAGVAVWLVPGVNLVLPRRVVARLWRAGEAGAAPPPLLSRWWAAWVVAVLAVVAAWTLQGAAETVADRQRIDALRAAATALSAVAAAFAIAVVGQVTRRQEARAAAVGAPRAQSHEDDDTSSTGGLRVVTEADARAAADPPPGR